MQNFKITLGSQYFEGLNPSGTCQRTTRIITADNQALATKVGNAMLGEEVATSEYFTGLISVESTDENPEIGGWDPDYTWSRVLDNLGDEDVFLVYDESGETVGVMTNSSIDKVELYH